MMRQWVNCLRQTSSPFQWAPWGATSDGLSPLADKEGAGNSTPWGRCSAGSLRAPASCHGDPRSDQLPGAHGKAQLQSAAGAAPVE
jgi:hypothetical protein